MAFGRSKLALGTVQFGLDYGISNTQGQVVLAEVNNILNECLALKINTLDTAAAYGESETVLGQMLPFLTDTFQIISKLPSCTADNVRAIFTNSLQQLQQKQIYGYLIHDFAAFEKDSGIFDSIYQLQQEGLIQKIGFSFYFPHQLERVLHLKLPVQLIQIPFNVFDQRFASLFSQLAERQIEVHIRSVFLQGLVFKAPEELPAYFNPFRASLVQLQNLSEQTGLSLPHILLSFAHLHPEITKMVVGVTSAASLLHNNNYTNYLESVKPLFKELKTLASTDERLLLPFNWKLT